MLARRHSSRYQYQGHHQLARVSGVSPSDQAGVEVPLGSASQGVGYARYRWHAEHSALVLVAMPSGDRGRLGCMFLDYAAHGPTPALIGGSGQDTLIVPVAGDQPVGESSLDEVGGRTVQGGLAEVVGESEDVDEGNDVAWYHRPESR